MSHLAHAIILAATYEQYVAAGVAESAAWRNTLAKYRRVVWA